jgi:hypothetical protein
MESDRDTDNKDCEDLKEDLKDDLRVTFQLADKILMASEKDPKKAFMTAIGTLAQVVYITTPNEHREETLKNVSAILMMYLEILDDVRSLANRS